MDSKENTNAAFEKITEIALHELGKTSLPKETLSNLEKIVALARYKFDITANKAFPNE